MEKTHDSVAETRASPSHITSSAALSNLNFAQYKQSHQLGHYSGIRRKRSFSTNRKYYKRETDIEDQLNSDEEGDGEENEIENEELGEENEEEEIEEYSEPKHDRLDEENDEVKVKTVKLHTPFWDTYDSINQLYLELSE